MIAPVLANLGPFEELAFKPNPEEVQTPTDTNANK